MRHTLEDIARATGLELTGDGGIAVTGPVPPAQAGPDDLAIAMSPDYGSDLQGSECRAAVVWADADINELGLQGALIAPRPRVALAHLTAHFAHPDDTTPGIHPSAIIAPDAQIGADAAVGPFAVIGGRAQIGAGARIGSHVSIGSDAVIGARMQARDGSRIGARCVIGDDLFVHSNAVIGADGFSFEPPQRGAVEAAKQDGDISSAVQTAKFLRIHSLAAVEIGDDVEIGACATIDRGTLAPTRIGSGTKIDNQVQIGHNVQIGQTCLICAHVGIAGSARIGDRVVLAGKVGIGDHIKIGSDVVCAAGTMVASNIRSGSVMMGVPATTRERAIAEVMAIKRLPRVLDQVAEIRKKLGL